MAQELIRSTLFGCGHHAPLRVTLDLELPNAERQATTEMDAACERASGMPCGRCSKDDAVKWHDRLNGAAP